MRSNPVRSLLAALATLTALWATHGLAAEDTSRRVHIQVAQVEAGQGSEAINQLEIQVFLLDSTGAPSLALEDTTVSVSMKRVGGQEVKLSDVVIGKGTYVGTFWVGIESSSGMRTFRATGKGLGESTASAVQSPLASRSEPKAEAPKSPTSQDRSSCARP